MDYLAQNTIYPDPRSSPVRALPLSSKATTMWAACPTMWSSRRSWNRWKLLFKDEVRQLEPGVGASRSPGQPSAPSQAPASPSGSSEEVTKEKADTLRQADFIFRDILTKSRAEPMPKPIFRSSDQYALRRRHGGWQDIRPYAGTPEAVTTDDFMTADWAWIPYEVLDQVSVRIVNEVKGSTASFMTLQVSPGHRGVGVNRYIKLSEPQPADKTHPAVARQRCAVFPRIGRSEKAVSLKGLLLRIFAREGHAQN